MYDVIPSILCVIYVDPHGQPFFEGFYCEANGGADRSIPHLEPDRFGYEVAEVRRPLIPGACVEVSGHDALEPVPDGSGVLRDAVHFADAQADRLLPYRYN